MNDAARLLLSVLAMFPDGLTQEIMLDLPGLDTGGESVESLGDRLLDTSLAFTQSAGSGGGLAFRLLVPIREYIDKRTPHLADNVLESLLSWVNEVAMDRDLIHYTMKYMLRSTPTVPQLSNLVDTAWRLMVMTRAPSYVSFGGIDDDILQQLTDLSSSYGGQRNVTACKALDAVPATPRHSKVTDDPFEPYISIFVDLGDVHKQAECLMLRGIYRSKLLRDFDLRAIEDFQSAVQVSYEIFCSFSPNLMCFYPAFQSNSNR